VAELAQTSESGWTSVKHQLGLHHTAAATDVQQELLNVAADVLEAEHEELEVERGWVRYKKNRNKSIKASSHRPVPTIRTRRGV